MNEKLKEMLALRENCAQEMLDAKDEILAGNKEALPEIVKALDSFVKIMTISPEDAARLAGYVTFMTMGHCLDVAIDEATNDTPTTQH